LAALTVVWTAECHAVPLAHLASRSAAVTVWGDLDGDGRPDEVVVHGHGGTDTIAFLLSSARSESWVSVGAELSAVSMVDVDGDGDLDLITTSWAGSELWLNDGHGIFTLSTRSSSRTLSAPEALDPDCADHPFAVFPSPSAFVVRPAAYPASHAVRVRAPADQRRASPLHLSARHPRAPPAAFAIA
jgi:hypothetical protein